MRRLLLLAVVFFGVAASAQTYKALDNPNDFKFCEGTTGCTTGTADTTGAKLAVVTCATAFYPSTCTVTSSFTASWASGVTVGDSGYGNTHTMTYAIAPSTSSSATVTCTASVSAPTDCDVRYYSLSSGTPAFDTSASASSGGSSVSSISVGSMTLAATNDLVVTAWAGPGSIINTMLPSSPFLLAFEPTDAHQFIAIGYSAATDNAPHNMTSDSAPSPFVTSASTEQNPAYEAFDGVYGSNSWLGNNSGTDWMCIDLGSAKAINVYTLIGTQDTPPRDPKAWTFSGSNTSCTSGMATLDTQSNQTFWVSSPNYAASYPIPNTTAYRYYRIDTSSNNGGNPYTGFAEENLYTLGSLGSTTITPTWSICSGSGCGSADRMAAIALAFKVQTATARARVQVIQH